MCTHTRTSSRRPPWRAVPFPAAAATGAAAGSSPGSGLSTAACLARPPGRPADLSLPSPAAAV